MARKKKSKTQLSVIKFIVIGLLVAGLGYVAVNRTVHLFRHADYFKIRSISIGPSLPFIDQRGLKNLVGKNIFEVDLKAAQRRMSYKYPQAAQLKIVKRFPNQIAVVAKQRLPFAQMHVQSRTLTLDEDGVILSLEEIKDKKLPFIVGVKSNNPKLGRGLPLKGAEVRMALKILKLFQANSGLAKYSIEEINITNLSKIYFTLSNSLQVIIDQDKIAQKIKVLGVVLAQDQLDLKQVKYIDLRFKEPIIGKK